MTVSSSTDRETFQGNGITTSFPLPFRFFSNADVRVQLVNKSTGEITPQFIGIHYNLDGAGEPEVDGNADSTLTMFVAPATGFSLFAQRVMDPVQPTDIVNQGRFLPEIHENVFDRLTMLIQQAFGFLGDSLSQPVGSNYYDAKGRQIKNLADPSDPQDAATRNWAQQYIASILATGQGPVNNATNVIYFYPDGAIRTVQSLSSAIGSEGVGHLMSTVGKGLPVFPEAFGAKGDGVTDDTLAIQNAFNANPAGVYFRGEAGKVYAVTRLDIPSNSIIDLCQSTIKKLPGSVSPDHLLRADVGCHNTLVKNGKLIGDKITHLNGTGEGVHNVFLYPGCYDLTFCNIETADAFGDGFYTGDFGTEAAPRNIRLINVRAAGCRRQGFSVTSANGLYMLDCSAEDIGDTVGPWPLPNGPWGGLDIEPNAPRSVLDNIYIKNFRTRNCKGMGMGFALVYKMRGLAVAESFNITVDGHTDFGSGEGFFCIGGSLGGSGGPNARLIGRVLLMNQTFLNNQENGINVAHWSTAKGTDANAGPVLEIVRPTVINYGRAGNPSVLRSSGIQLHNSHPSGNDYGSMRGIKITEPTSLVQPDVAAATGYAINVANSVAGRGVVDVRISDVSRIVGRINCLSGATDVRLSGTPESVPFSAVSGQILGYGGVLATHVTAAASAALVIGQNALGAEMEVSGLGGVTLTAVSGVTLRDSTSAVIPTVTLTSSGATVRLKWVSATAVLVTKVYGSITP